MKTKIIYVLVSNENDCYLEQALVSIYSLRLYNPDANLLLLVLMKKQVERWKMAFVN